MIRTLKISTVSVLTCNAKTREVSDVKVDVISFPGDDVKKAAKIVDEKLAVLAAKGTISPSQIRVAWEIESVRNQKTRMSDEMWLAHCEFVDDDTDDDSDDESNDGSDE